MAEFRLVHTRFWSDREFATCTPEERYFYLYLLTNPLTSASGIYELTIREMVFHTGYNEDTIRKLLERFIKSGKIGYDSDNEEVYLKNWIKFNPPRGVKMVTRVTRELEEVHTGEFVTAYIKQASRHRYTFSVCGYTTDGTKVNKCKPVIQNTPFPVADTLSEIENGVPILERERIQIQRQQQKQHPLAQPEPNGVAQDREHDPFEDLPTPPQEKKATPKTKKPSAKKKAYPQERYNARLEVYEHCLAPEADAGLTGQDYKRARAGLKRMFSSGVSDEDIDGTMGALAELKKSGARWVSLWTMEQVEKCIARFRRGELKPVQQRASPKPKYGLGMSPEEIARREHEEPEITAENW